MADFTAIDGLVKSAIAAPEAGATKPSAPSAPDQAKTRDLAAQFESLLIAQLMKDLQASMAEADDEKGEDGFDASPLRDAMNSELGLALSRAGGFGLGESLAGTMLRQVAPDLPANVDPSLLNLPLLDAPSMQAQPAKHSSGRVAPAPESRD